MFGIVGATGGSPLRMDHCRRGRLFNSSPNNSNNNNETFYQWIIANI